eukprot:15903487-Heterocapsa_arctica.AAC.1
MLAAAGSHQAELRREHLRRRLDVVGEVGDGLRGGQRPASGRLHEGRRADRRRAAVGTSVPAAGPVPDH